MNGLPPFPFMLPQMLDKHQKRGDLLEEKIQVVHEVLKNLFPDAVSIEVFVNCEGITVAPNFKTNISGFSMQTVTRKWVQKAK